MRVFFLGALFLAGAALSATTPDQKGFIRDWLVAGPYPSYQTGATGQGYHTDLLAHMGGEAGVRPYEGLRDRVLFKADKAKLIAGIGSTNEWGFTEDKEFPVTWTPFRVEGEKPDLVFDKRFLPIDDYMVIYSVCYIESSEARDIKLRIGADDDFKVFLNGKPVGGSNTSQGIKPDTFLYDAQLKRGLNVLVMKLVDRTHGCGFCLAVSDRAGNPVPGLAVRLDDPARTAMLRDKLKHLPSVYDNGFYTTVETAGRFAGKNEITLTPGGEQKGSFRAHLILTRDNGKAIEFRKELTFPARWQEAVTLEAGIYTARLTLTPPGTETPAAILEENFEIFDPGSVKKQNTELRQKQSKLRKKLSLEQAREKELLAANAKLHKEHEALYAATEAFYSAMRKANRGGAECDSVDEALPAVPDRILRRRILLNGDNWRISPEQKEEWSSVSFPRIHFDRYFRSSHYPVKNAEQGNNYGKLLPLPGWEDFTFDETLLLNRFRARLEIDLGPDAPERSWRFLCDSVNGALKTYVNGQYCGSWEGNIGLLEIPLKNVKPGVNTLELRFADPRTEFKLTKTPMFMYHFGITGNLYLESSATPVRLGDATIRSSWRKNTLSVRNTVYNSSGKEVKVKAVTSCVLGGRVRFRLPELNEVIPPRSELVFDGNGTWNDPELWGIGGRYGDPVLYTLVTDLSVDGEPVDRSVEPFGFREFWISGSDFYLNGRHILLQGDVGAKGLDTPKQCEVSFPLYRKDGINIMRNHDGAFYSPEFFRSCDRLGMLAYANMYPVLHEPGRDTMKNFIPYDEFLAGPRHEFNLRNYRRWVHMVRNHPSVVILSTDNEIFTQSWDTPAQEEFNIRNDRLGALYGRYVKKLDPDRILTRNGDAGTWGFHDKWREDPPCETANYHYPDFNTDRYVLNWQSVFGHRPVIYGETLYYSYGAWDKWIGAVPKQVEDKAKRVREVASLYRKLKVPGQIYMGLSHDGFILFDESGKGNPWGIRASEHDAGKVQSHPGYPWAKIPWPSLSGAGARTLFVSIDAKRGGMTALNWFDSAAPSHIRNAVNEAYRDSLTPMPPLASAPDAECLIETAPGKVVYAATPLLFTGVQADRDGRAWLTLPEPGKYQLTSGGEKRSVILGGRAEYAAQPGFSRIMKINWSQNR